MCVDAVRAKGLFVIDMDFVELRCSWFQGLFALDMCFVKVRCSWFQKDICSRCVSLPGSAKARAPVTILTPFACGWTL